MLEVHLAGGGQRESKQHDHLQVPPHDGSDADAEQITYTYIFAVTMFLISATTWGTRTRKHPTNHVLLHWYLTKDTIFTFEIS